eukprot:26530-Pleurochrysis_carterae.AAC.3
MAHWVLPSSSLHNCSAVERLRSPAHSKAACAERLCCRTWPASESKPAGPRRRRRARTVGGSVVIQRRELS